ncbi:putative disease resistance protein At3g14460 [Arachis stenosperma]|uniref:putative disease resistance protein At3g14460 n=1 Tax=Arachis stenosperma TaxID=217475 RepID=UPI0025ACD881|nr:putative disease resistance protein At3g14460 [Arachis stenosperma]
MKQFGNPLVRKWLDSLRDAVYCADDLLDSVLIKAKTGKKLRSSWSISFFKDRHREMVDRMEEVVTKIEYLGNQKDSLGLGKIPTGSSSWRIPSSSLVRGNVYGREDDKKALVQMLNDNNENQLSVIAIVGIGGVGKTTLAQWLYNNQEEFMTGFDLKAWVCVSEKFEVVETTRNVIKQIYGGSCSLDDFNSLQNALKGELSNKKFFIVLDDVWSDDGDKWSNFMTPFQYGKKGSIVLLTTRGENVALAVKNCRPYYLGGLSEHYCWSVFADNASFQQSNGSAELEVIGREIVKKCRGLPLAAETLGRLLRAKHDVQEWKDILTSNIWEFSVEKSKIIPALLISYFYLPAHLKRCFVYCSLFPKDYKFKKNELILLWMAEDLLPSSKGRKSLEEVGCECFDELTSRLFFTKIQNDGDYFVMHDLLHDLAIFLAGDFYCNSEELGEEEISNQTRHLCVNLSRCSPKLYNSISKVESLRTLLLIKDLFSPDFNVEMATHEILSKCKYLRVLSHDQLDVLPDSMGKLIHLRYLNLSYCHIKKLPESLCNLCVLQTLRLHRCVYLSALPSDLHHLVSLRHLDIRETFLPKMPGKLSKLNQLQTLNHFVVSKHKHNGIQQLGGLPNLHGSLEIEKLENIVDVKEAESAKISDKHIDELSLEWSSGADMVSNTQTERDMLVNLQPHYELKELRIKGYKGTTFPDWLGNCSYNYVTGIFLDSCKNCCILPSLGQLPCLKSLWISRFDKLESVGKEFYKSESDHHSLPYAPFPSLETLEFDDMPCLKVWHISDSEYFPPLRKLAIRNCPMLEGEMLHQVFLRTLSSLSAVSKICRLEGGLNEEMYSYNGNGLSIRGTESVKSALKAICIDRQTCLQEIQIHGCSFAISFPGNCLPKSLKWLAAINCSKLEFPEQQQQKYDLVELYISSSCDSLTSLSLDAFPNLKTLTLYGCKNLESVSMSEPSHAALQSLTIKFCHNFVSFPREELAALQSLAIFECYSFVSFPREGLAAPNLTNLDVQYCNKLEALPYQMNTLLPKLHSLYVHSIPIPEGGFPPNLKELAIGGPWRTLSSISNLDALTHLTMYGDKYESTKPFPDVGSLHHLPSLTTLYLSNFYRMETLESNQLLHLTSLQHLHILYAPKLKNIAGEKLPSSLLLLELAICGFLGEYCKNKHQQIWPKISHIPTILVDGQQVF